MKSAASITMLVLLSACAGKTTTAPEQAAPLQATSAEPESTQPESERPSPPPIVETPGAERAGPAPLADGEQPPVDASATTEARAMPGPNQRDDDGRPEWWLREPRWSEARLTVCAEALGETVRDARRAAVDAGLDRLRTMLEREAEDAEIVVTTVRPLPVPAQAPGGKRFVGYVMVTVRTDQADSSR